MKLLQELHNLHEAELPGVNHVELAALVKHFPNNYKKAIEKLWGGPRLTYNGIPFYPENGKGIYKMAQDAAESWHAQGGTISVSMPTVEYKSDEEGAEPVDIEMDYEDEVNPEENGQEVYMGYNPTTDELSIGYDLSFNEETFNEEWDKAFEQATNEQFDYDNPAHQKAFHEAHKNFNALHAWALFKLKWDGQSFEVDDHQEGDGGFYPEGEQAAKQQNLIDLRLD